MEGTHMQWKKENGRRILLIEDNPDTAHTLQMLLTLVGHDVRVAYTGPEGVRTAVDWHPDVIVADIGLPGLDGYGVAQQIRQHPALGRIPLIALTAYSAGEDRLLARASGYDHFLAKPVEPDALLGLVMAAGS